MGVFKGPPGVVAPCVSVLTRQKRMGRTAAPLAGRCTGREERPGIGGELPVTRSEAPSASAHTTLAAERAAGPQGIIRPREAVGRLEVIRYPGAGQAEIGHEARYHSARKLVSP